MWPYHNYTDKELIRELSTDNSPGMVELIKRFSNNINAIYPESNCPYCGIRVEIEVQPQRLNQNESEEQKGAPQSATCPRCFGKCDITLWRTT